MNITAPRLVLALVILTVAVYSGVRLIQYSEADDAPGGVVIGFVMMLVALVVSVRIARARR